MSSRSDRSITPRDRRHPVLLSLVVTGLCLLGVAGPGQAAGADAAPGRTASFRGLTVTVPAGWSVVDLATTPAACVRFDRHAVYLGAPSPSQVCPADVQGRTEALLVEPIESPGDPTPADVTAPGPSVSTAVPGASTTLGEIRVDIPPAAVQVTATWNTDPDTIRTVLASGSATPGWHPVPQNRSAAPARPPLTDRVMGVKGFKGMGFDTCSAPSLATMDKWLTSPYRAVGVYIGGNNRSCAQPNLTSSWINTVVDRGWKVIPIYVGYQAPVNICRCASLTPASADRQGRDAADDAVAKAKALGMALGSPVYFDMEGYERGSTNTPGVMSFLSAWTTRLHQLGYQSGVYSGSLSGLSDLVAAGSKVDRPDSVWYANWDGRNATLGDRWLPDSVWTHSRIHQYQSGNDAYGGITMDIDRNAIDTTLVGSIDITPREPDPPPLAVTPASVPPVTVRDYINRVYIAEVNRPPTTDESNFWTWVFTAGAPVADLSNGLLYSDEWAQYQVAAQYMIVLRRPADSSGGPFWGEWIKAHRNPDALAADLASSEEYWSSAGRDPSAYVGNLYRDLVGRAPDPGGLSYWTGQVRSGRSRYSVALSFTATRERSEMVVTNAFRVLLRREPDRGALAAFVTVFEQARDPASVLAPVATSPEAVNLAK